MSYINPPSNFTRCYLNQLIESFCVQGQHFPYNKELFYELVPFVGQSVPTPNGPSIPIKTSFDISCNTRTLDPIDIQEQVNSKVPLAINELLEKLNEYRQKHSPAFPITLNIVPYEFPHNSSAPVYIYIAPNLAFQVTTVMGSDVSVYVGENMEMIIVTLTAICTYPPGNRLDT
jgi:hypothetical protein